MEQDLEESCGCFSGDNTLEAALGRALRRSRADFVLLSLGRAKADRVSRSRARERWDEKEKSVHTDILLIHTDMQNSCIYLSIYLFCPVLLAGSVAWGT